MSAAGIVVAIVAFYWDYRVAADCYMRVKIIYAFRLMQYILYCLFQAHLTYHVVERNRYAFKIRTSVISIFIARLAVSITVVFLMTWKVAKTGICSSILSTEWTMADRIFEIVYDALLAVVVIGELSQYQFKFLYDALETASVLLFTMIIQILYVTLLVTSTDPTVVGLFANIPSFMYSVYILIFIGQTVGRKIPKFKSAALEVSYQNLHPNEKSNLSIRGMKSMDVEGLGGKSSKSISSHSNHGGALEEVKASSFTRDAAIKATSSFEDTNPMRVSVEGKLEHASAVHFAQGAALGQLGKRNIGENVGFISVLTPRAKTTPVGKSTEKEDYFSSKDN